MPRLPFLLCAGAVALAFASALKLQAESKPVELFNGRDLAGWTQEGGRAKFEVRDGVIVGIAVTNTGNSFLCTTQAFGDCILEYEFKVDPRLNSGVQIRSLCFDTPYSLPWEGKTVKVPARRVHGLQVEIDNDANRKRWWSGGLYEEGRRGWLYPGPRGGDGKAFTEQGARMTKPDDWNHVRVVARGPRVEVFFNGELRATIEDDLTLVGFIALQVHGIGNNRSLDGATVMWRNFRLEALTPPTEWVKTPPASASDLPAN